ncbi:hypothetical protein L0222_26415 [bacterium]|nr:hypothetical protein [bacterium]MCI0603704.1 hypothetical protein [bacterium]
MKKSFLVLLLCLSCVTPVMAQFYREDFTSDTNSSQPGFASSIFVHSNSGGYALIAAPFAAPDPPHAIEIFHAFDEITFALGPGEQVQHARVYVNSAFGHCRVVFQGANLDVDGVTPVRKTFDFNAGNTVWQSVEVDNTTIGDQILPPQPAPALGFIQKITLWGGESIYDSIEIDVVGGNPNPETVGVLVNPRTVNPNDRNGLIRLTVLTDANFDALTIDVNTVNFGNATGAINAIAGDVESDGDTDLLLFFRFRDVGVICGDISIPFTAMTVMGDSVQGTGAINVVGCP